MQIGLPSKFHPSKQKWQWNQLLSFPKTHKFTGLFSRKLQKKNLLKTSRFEEEKTKPIHPISTVETVFFWKPKTGLSTFVKKGFIGLQGFKSIDVDTLCPGKRCQSLVHPFFPSVFGSPKTAEDRVLKPGKPFWNTWITGGFLVGFWWFWNFCPFEKNGMVLSNSKLRECSNSEV